MNMPSVRVSVHMKPRGPTMARCVAHLKMKGNAHKHNKASIIAGLTHLAESSGLGESLEELTGTLIAWMKEDEPSEHVISMCSVASRYEKNAQRMGEENLVHELMHEIDNTANTSPKYYNGGWGLGGEGRVGLISFRAEGQGAHRSSWFTRRAAIR